MVELTRSYMLGGPLSKPRIPGKQSTKHNLVNSLTRLNQPGNLTTNIKLPQTMFILGQPGKYFVDPDHKLNKIFFLLRWDPTKRITASEALKHNWILEVRWKHFFLYILMLGWSIIMQQSLNTCRRKGGSPLDDF